ncbi:MAG: cupin domain-containing protein [Anaerolineales bacterium]|nr:cupin domain-containing protein [Anaerolineales bacterium]
MDTVNLADKFSLFSELWTPKIIAGLNGQLVKLAKLKGEFIWHRHDQEDELFLVIRGDLRIDLHDRTLKLGAGDLVVIPAGVEHRPVAPEEAWVMLLEPASTLHTGNTRSDRTVDQLEWI